MQAAFGDEAPDQGMNGGKGASILHSQSGQGVNVKKSAVVDVAPRQPPICQPVVLALEQMVQGLHGSRFAARRLVGAQAALNDILGSGDRRKFGLERRRVGARRVVRAATSGSEPEELAARRFVAGAGLAHDLLQDLAVPVWADRESMLVIPGGKAAFGVVVSKGDFAVLKCLAVGTAENGNQNPAAGAPRQCLPIDIESGRVRGFRAPFHDVKPPWFVGVEDTHVIGNEVENEAYISRRESIA